MDLIDENVDCVVRGGELTKPSLRARHVADLPLGVYAAPAYLARAGKPAHRKNWKMAITGSLRTRGSRAGTPAINVMRRGDEQLRLHGRYVLSVDDGNAYLAAGIAGLGVLWLPRYMARAPLAQRALVPLFKHWHVDPMPLHIAFPPSRHVSRKLRVFIDWVVELLATHAPAIQPP